MSSPDVLPEQPVGSTSFESEVDDDEFSSPSGPLPTIKTYDEDSSIAKLPGTSLLRSVHKPKNISNHESIKSLQSDHTYDFDEKNGGDDASNADEFGEDLAGSPVPSGKKQLNGGPSKLPTGKVPAWKLRQQMRADVPPPPKTIVSSENGESADKVSPLRRARKKRSEINKSSPRTHRKTGSDDQNWFKKITTKRETPEEKEKREKNEALMKKQTSSRWGKDILEEDDEEEGDGKHNSKKKVAEPEEEEEEDSDTVKKVKSLIEKSFGSALVSTIKKDKEAENAENDEKKEDEPQKPNRPNRWAMVGSAAMTSMRNVQKGLMGGDEHGDDKKTDTETITEEDEDGDKIADIKPDQNRRQAMWRNRGAAAFTSVRNAWGGDAEARRKELMNGDESSSHAHDDLDSKSAHSDPGRHDSASLSDTNKSKDQNLLSHIGNFWQHTRARFDPEVWNDPEIKETLVAIEMLRTKLHDNRHKHRNETRRRERQIENSISQQKNFLARRLARQMYNYRSNPFHPCIKEVYEKEILIIVHEVTNLGVDDESEAEKDGIDKLLDSERFDFDYDDESDEEVDVNEGQDTLGAFFGKQKEAGGEKKRSDAASVDGSLFSVDGSTVQVAGHNSVVPHQTRLIRAQHNEMIIDHQMKLVRSFQQKSIEEWYDVLPEQRKEHDKLKAIPQSALEAKVKEMEESNKKMKEAYQAHVEVQEKLLAIYRERYVPSEHDEEDEENTKEENGEEEDGFKSQPSSPMKGVPKRPGMWAKNLSQSVRGLFGPKTDEDGENTADNNESVDRDAGQSLEGGFDLPSPMTTGSANNKKFLLSFGSPAGSKAASGILANFAAPLPLSSSKDDEGTDDKQSQQDSAKDSAKAAWTVPSIDKASLPDSLAEKRAKRAAARRAARPDADETNGTARKATATTSASRSELLQRARKARQESAAALGGGKNQPTSPTPSSRTGRSSLRSNTASTRKELSMKDLMAAAGDSRRKLMENDSRMERLSEKKNQLSKSSPLSSPTPSVTSSRAASRLSEERRLRIMREMRADEGLSRSSHHSLHERKPMGRSLKSMKGSIDDEDEEPVPEEHLQDVDEFGGEAQ